MNPEINELLKACLDQFEALNNACTYTQSFALRNRLRAALNLPLEVVEETPEAPICPTCGDYVADCECPPCATWQSGHRDAMAMLPTVFDETPRNTR